MRLDKIKLAGFKSFVDVTHIPFPDNMTAIVGPNGCGKSNVIDAVRWVLGESSAKNLRGDAMTDVIFNGSSVRKPVSQCSVELVFDNSSGRVQGEYAKYNELSVKRLVNRDGQSLYFLNGSKCRRRDITDIFLGTGLGPRSYAIIEQGMISRLIESKPQELRVFIEEAAGISKYKERRRETETRIRHTRDNLERLEDVRIELSQQLDKLKRQAAAATRYKQFRERERTLKAELATVRWIKHDRQVAEFAAKIQQQEVQIEKFIAEQRGGEKDIEVFHQQQQSVNLELADLQSTLFNVGTEISRRQQNQLHQQQRQTRIKQELVQLQQNLHEAVEHRQQQQQQYQALQHTLQDQQPELEVLEEAQAEAEEALAEIEIAHQDKQQQFRQQQQDYLNIRHQVEQREAKIKSLQIMADRSQTRLQQLNGESQSLDIHQQQQAVQQVQQQLEQNNLEQQQLVSQLDRVQSQLQTEQAEYQQHGAKQDKRQKTLDTAQAEHNGIVNLLNAQQNTLSQQLDDDSVEYQHVWQYLTVSPEWLAALEMVCEPWQNTCILQADTGLLWSYSGKAWYEAEMVTDKPKGSLAEIVQAERVPEWFTRILLCDDLAEAQGRQQSLNPTQSILTKDGHWVGHGYHWSKQSDEQDGVLKQQQRKQQLAQSIEESKLTLQKYVLQSEAFQGRIVELQTDENKLSSAVAEHQRQQQQLVLQQQHNQQQLVQLQQRQQTLQQDIVMVEAQVEEEQIEIETLREEIEQIADNQNQHEFQQRDNDVELEQLLKGVQTCRQQYQNIKHDYHHKALQLQSVKTQLESLETSQKREQQQVVDLQYRQQQLTDEANELVQPDTDGDQSLAELLATKLEIEAAQQQLNSKLAEIDEQLRSVEQGTRGVQQKVDDMRSTLERDKLDCEGQRVRANSILDQLTELGNSLKTVLETLPDEAEEQTWQQELDSVQRAIGRLGAVNLAAVEEYSQQSERKSHLDSQFDDLTTALDTLEAAIKKIDKETRSRFKQTFEQVNGDLKTLFPKVFGGGAAYLDLTDENLLDTGVTIMARPPGKKNSTIHLLSGGEKALTALSLVFAIFRLNPAPFCLLDEVDAPLDDANVGRFCKLVTEMSKTVQFIYITHNKIAMEMANHLTGVTMAEPGVSRMVSVTVDQAASLVEE